LVIYYDKSNVWDVKPNRTILSKTDLAIRRHPTIS
jgi:hypothetical protein